MITPSDIAKKPTVCDGPQETYDFARQMRIAAGSNTLATPMGNSTQTFNSQGKPIDSDR
jgi:hypothetical protein